MVLLILVHFTYYLYLQRPCRDAPIRHYVLMFKDKCTHTYIYTPIYIHIYIDYVCVYICLNVMHWKPLYKSPNKSQSEDAFILIIEIDAT